MMLRTAAFFILVSQLALLALALGFSGATSTLFFFVGHPVLAVGLALTAFVVLSRRQVLVRSAALLILISQAILLVLVFDFSGYTSILFSFAGHPALIAGLGLTAFIVWSGRNYDPDQDQDQET
jgi:hypothetical protein